MALRTLERPDTRSAFARKLANLVPLTADDHAAIAAFLSGGRVRRFPAASNIHGPGSANAALILMEGFAYRYRQRRNGSNQVLSFVVPGDVVQPLVRSHARTYFGLYAPVACTFRSFRMGAGPLAIQLGSERIASALFLSRAQEENLLYERCASFSLPSGARTAALFCELYVRLRAVGLAEDERYILPLSQEELASALALSPMYVNRILGTLKKRNLVETHRNTVVIRDFQGLRNFAGWNPSYLMFSDEREKYSA